MELFNDINTHDDVISLVPLLREEVTNNQPSDSDKSTKLELLETDSFEVGGALSTTDDPSMLCVSCYLYQTEFTGDYSSLYYRVFIRSFRLGSQHSVATAHSAYHCLCICRVVCSLLYGVLVGQILA